MVNKKWILSVMMVGVLASGLLAGCGAKKTEGDEEVISVIKEETKLTYLGHAGVKIVSKDGTVIYIDPNYEGADYSDKADYVLITHSHDDHTKNRKVILQEDGVILKNSDMLVKGEYITKDFGNVKVEAVAAGNQNHDIRYCVGYLVTVDGLTIYHPGDTSMIDEMRLLSDRQIDYAFYPIDGIYNMDALEATEVANLVGATHNIPFHEYNQPGENKADNFNPEGRIVLEYGETIVIGE